MSEITLLSALGVANIGETLWAQAPKPVGLDLDEGIEFVKGMKNVRLSVRM